jgi:hypothetical protein
VPARRRARVRNRSRLVLDGATLAPEWALRRTGRGQSSSAFLGRVRCSSANATALTASTARLVEEAQRVSALKRQFVSDASAASPEGRPMASLRPRNSSTMPSISSWYSTSPPMWPAPGMVFHSFSPRSWA